MFQPSSCVRYIATRGELTQYAYVMRCVCKRTVIYFSRATLAQAMVALASEDVNRDCGASRVSRIKQSLVVMMFRSCLCPNKDADEGAGSIARTLATLLLTGFGFRLVPFNTRGNPRGTFIWLSDNEIFHRVLQITMATSTEEVTHRTRSECPPLDTRVYCQETILDVTSICARVNVSERVVLSYIYICI